jgi:hypothetical protein
MGTDRENFRNSSPKNRLKNGSFRKGAGSDEFRLETDSTSMFTTAGDTSFTICTTGLSE